jgi:O-antigen/teichoic acid export membrane protein
MLGLAGVAENFVRVLLGDNWLPAAYYIQIASFATMFDVVAVGNCETIKAMGRSDVFLTIEIIKKIGYFVTLIMFLSFSYSPQILAISLLVCTAIQVVVNSIPNRKLIGYKIKYQIADLVPNIFISVIMHLSVLLIGKIECNSLILLICQIILGGLIYCLLSYATRNKSFYYIINMLKIKDINRD